MTRKWTLGVFLAGALGVLAAPSAQAASLQQVSNWNGGVTGLPSDVLMFVYKPDKVAANPPLLTLIHYCGGSAQAVLGQAKGNGTTDGGIVQAADQFGFIIVVPSNANASGANGRCWDVSSAKAQKREGGGDPQAIYQMVKYALSQYHANADRVYSTGDSSGAMMTELLLALYPDVFKAGSTFAGVPAGCSNVFDGSGLCGLSAQTAQQWGDRVRAMDPGYTGHRPRVQLFHGDADGTITYKNMGEAIKEWTNVLGLSSDPPPTQSGFTLGTHQATRQSWKNACGYVVLDALTSIGGDHGPSDTLFVGKYVLPFLGLDSQAAVDAAVDPEVAQCGGGGGDAGVTTGDGGTDTNKADGAGGGTGGSTSGGSGGRDGNAGAGGSNSGGSSGTAGEQSTGGKATGGSQNGTGGASGTGGAQGSGGTSTGGSTANGSGGAQGNGGAAGSSSGGGGSNGCSCALGGARSREGMNTGALVLGLALAILVRRRRHQC
jgi:acetylxylan esterase